MKKPSHEEKTDLRQELKILSLFFILISSDMSFTQVPLNGFCKLTTFMIDSGYNNLSGFNFNNDSYTDLIFVNHSNNKVLVAEGFGSGEFKAPVNHTFPLSLSSIEPIKNHLNETEAYAFTSRADRTFGIYTFSSTGSAYLNASYKFNSYPGRISIADINSDNRYEFLISGSNFSGLSILSLENKKFTETKLASNSSFSFAHFIDINSNGYKDIAAYNLNTGDIHFLYNDGEGNFKEARKISYQLQATQFRTFDLNLNYNNDLIISSGNSIKIYYGDSRSSFDTTVTITTLFPVDDFIIGDFNNDGYFDFIYLAKDKGIISTIFGSADGNFHKEFIHLKRNRIHAITHYISKFKNGVVYLADNGEVGLISRLNLLSNKFDLAIAVEPGALTFFDNELNGINDIAFLDRWNNSLNILIRNKEGIPAKFYSVPLFASQNDIIIDNTNKSIKKFYCLSDGSRLIEIVTVDFSTNKIEREQFYVPGKLLDLSFNNSDEDDPQIHTAYIKNAKHFIGVIRKQNNRYVFSELPLDDDVYGGVKWISLRTPVVSYWKMNENTLALYHSTMNDDELKTKLRQQTGTRQAEIFSLSKVYNNNDSYIQVSIIKSEINNSISIVSENNVTLLNVDKQFPGLRIKNKNHLSFGSGNSLFFYDEDRNTAGRIEISKTHNNLKVQNILRDIYAVDFIIVNLNFLNEHLIYTNKQNGSISVRQIE